MGIDLAPKDVFAARSGGHARPCPSARSCWGADPERRGGDPECRNADPGGCGADPRHAAASQAAPKACPTPARNPACIKRACVRRACTQRTYTCTQRTCSKRPCTWSETIIKIGVARRPGSSPTSRRSSSAASPVMANLVTGPQRDDIAVGVFRMRQGRDKPTPRRQRSFAGTR